MAPLKVFIGSSTQALALVNTLVLIMGRERQTFSPLPWNQAGVLENDVHFLESLEKLTKEVDVDIDVGLGSLTVKIPEEIGARIIYEKSWIAHIDLTRDFTEQQENNYYSSNYRTAAGKMNIKIDAGLGSVNIVRE